MFVYIYEVLVALHGKEPEFTHALVFAVCVQDAEHLLKNTAGVLEFTEDPNHVFSLPEFIQPQVILERNKQ